MKNFIKNLIVLICLVSLLVIAIMSLVIMFKTIIKFGMLLGLSQAFMITFLSSIAIFIVTIFIINRMERIELMDKLS